MINKVKLLTLFLFISIFSGNAQTIFTGKVLDFETKENIQFCHISILNQEVKTKTDIEGNFKITLNSIFSNNKFAFTCIGYIADTLIITPNSNINVYLKPIAYSTNEVVVTGVSKSTKIKENPVSISVVNAKTIEQTSESNIIDVLTKNVTGLNSVKTGPNISKPFIRGLGYNRILTLYDGVRQEGQQWGDEHGIEVDAYNIDKAEVIKGPASLMYGSDALAGVVSLMPAMPKHGDSTLKVKYFAEYQTNNNLIGNGLRITQNIKNWSYALRGSYRIASNYSNNIDGKVYNTGFREANISTLIGYKSKKGYSNLNFTLYDNFQGIPDGNRDSLSRKFTYQIFENKADDIKNRPIVSNSDLNSYKLSSLIQRIQHYRIYSFNTYSLGKGEIEALIAFQQNNRQEFNHPTNASQPGMHVRLNTLNYSIKYNLPTFHNFDLVFGSNGMYQNNRNIDATDFPIPDYNLFDAGIYGFTKWKYDYLTLSGGIRYDARKISSDDFYTKLDSTSNFMSHVNNYKDAILQYPAINKTFDGISFSVGSTFQFSEKISLKANIGRGYRAPSITEFAANGLDPGASIFYIGNNNFVPEFSLQEDIGLQGEFKNFSSSISLFNNNIQNFIYLSKLVDANGIQIEVVKGYKTYQYLQNAAHLYGTEFSLDIHPQKLKGLSINNSLAIAYGSNDKYKNKGINGEYLPFIPPFKIFSTLGKEFNIKSKKIKDLNVKFELDYNAAQNRYMALDNTETASSSYTLYNISTGFNYYITNKIKVLIMMQINNIFDIAYQSNLSRLKYFEHYNQSPNGKTGIYGMGRNICFKTVWNF